MQIDRAVLKASWQSWVSNDERPRAGPYWMQWLWTLLFSMVLAVGFTVLGFFTYGRARGAWRHIEGWLEWYGKNLLVCLVIGVIIHGLFDLGRHFVARPARLRRWRPWQRTLYYSGLPLLGVALGWPLGVSLVGVDLAAWVGQPQGSGIIAGSLFIGVVLTLLFHNFFASKARQVDAERRATEAQLRLLQAQIEPHFLFNTLANVHSLMDHDPARAKQMLQDFTDYLRGSLTALRSASSPLAQELELAENYLRVLGIRMDDRLRWRIDADAAARAVPVPPLLLQPLVENAIQHGLEPQLEGGSIQVTARVQGGELVLEVHDDGCGHAAPPRPGARKGHGMALANVRGRLLTRYGSAASLVLSDARPGTRATIRLPVDAAAP